MSLGQALGIPSAAMISRRIAPALLAVVLGLLLAPHEAAAATCMAVPSSSSDGSQPMLNVPDALIVADTFVPALQARGLEVAACPASLQTPTGQQALRDQICTLAFAGTEGDQIALAQRIGVPPALLCLAAEAQAGPWQGEKHSWSFQARNE